MDRNHNAPHIIDTVRQSLSARRAWIEIRTHACRHGSCTRSLSARRAWIEIARPRRGIGQAMSLSARRAWIEINNVETAAKASLSLSARRAWIEILRISLSGQDSRVALRKESVDRNTGVLVAL